MSRFPPRRSPLLGEDIPDTSVRRVILPSLIAASRRRGLWPRRPAPFLCTGFLVGLASILARPFEYLVMIYSGLPPITALEVVSAPAPPDAVVVVITPDQTRLTKCDGPDTLVLSREALALAAALPAASQSKGLLLIPKDGVLHDAVVAVVDVATARGYRVYLDPLVRSGTCCVGPTSRCVDRQR